MKRIISLLLLTTLLTLTLAIPVSAAPLAAPIRVLVDNVLIKFPDAQPFIDSSGRTQVPARFVSEALGGVVDWNGDTRTVTITRGADTITLKVGEQAITLNGKTKQLDTAALIKQERTFVPLRFVSEALGAGVTWEAQIMTAKITTIKSGDVVELNGFVMPVSTHAGYARSASNLPENTQMAFSLSYGVPNVEQQMLDIRNSIAGKFGADIADQMYTHIKTKKTGGDYLAGKQILIKATNQYLDIGPSSSGGINIEVYIPGYVPTWSYE